MKEFLQPAELLFAETSLLENLAEGSRRQRTGMHRHIGLSAVRMAQNFMTAARISLANTSRAENGIGYIELSNQRLRFDGNGLAARTFLGDPGLDQFLGRGERAFDALAMGG